MGRLSMNRYILRLCATSLIIDFRRIHRQMNTHTHAYMHKIPENSVFCCLFLVQFDARSSQCLINWIAHNFCNKQNFAFVLISLDAIGTLAYLYEYIWIVISIDDYKCVWIYLLTTSRALPPYFCNYLDEYD